MLDLTRRQIKDYLRKLAVVKDNYNYFITLKLGICIPTYNRSFEFNCLNSIYNSYTKFKKLKFEICILTMV